MSIFVVIAAIVFFVLFVVHLVMHVDPDRVAVAPFGFERESLGRTDRDRARIAGELSAIRAHDAGR